MSNREIVVENLVKRYGGDVLAVKDVSFRVKSGEIFGFLGPNGAGKSTTVAMLTTLILPTDGRATVAGFDVAKQASEVRQIAGVALQEIGIDPLMKSTELLTIQGQVFGMSRKQAQERARELLDLVKLSDVVDRRVGKYSGGMRRRLDLALALVHEPSVLFLDEPTTGLDPASRRDIWSEVRRLNKRLGITIFLTTQYLEEADELADRIAIINGGRIAAEGTPAELKAQMGTESINLTFGDVNSVAQAAQVLTDLGARMQEDRKTLRLYLKGAANAVPAVVTRLQNANLSLSSLTLTQPTLDDVFLKVTGKRLESDATPEETAA
ncbi:MAG: ATP-binding cassette domain-containing protein [Anaerolinea sp.]|nr:ATP-binding cassette domain-containing protein [Anaerolinea sp.]CAG0964135.1 Daunorubicin/doxorubicin resistance ATP-binding protein DrrA [Anaerolineae bacterium]